MPSHDLKKNFFFCIFNSYTTPLICNILSRNTIRGNIFSYPNVCRLHWRGWGCRLSPMRRRRRVSHRRGWGRLTRRFHWRTSCQPNSSRRNWRRWWRGWSRPASADCIWLPVRNGPDRRHGTVVVPGIVRLWLERHLERNLKQDWSGLASRTLQSYFLGRTPWSCGLSRQP